MPPISFRLGAASLHNGTIYYLTAGLPLASALGKVGYQLLYFGSGLSRLTIGSCALKGADE